MIVRFWKKSISCSTLSGTRIIIIWCLKIMFHSLNLLLETFFLRWPMILTERLCHFDMMWTKKCYLKKKIEKFFKISRTSKSFTYLEHRKVLLREVSGQKLKRSYFQHFGVILSHFLGCLCSENHSRWI